MGSLNRIEPRERQKDELTDDEKRSPVVSILCATYNHERYISEAIDSFLAQEVNFPIEIIVHDDASTDRTGAIVSEYAERHPGLIRCITQHTNQYSQGVRIPNLLLQEARGQLIAYCEGDDFWHCSEKIKLQKEYLDSHPEVGAVFTNKNVHMEAMGLTIRNYDSRVARNLANRDLRRELIAQNPFSTCTVMFRRDAVNGYAAVADRLKSKMDDYVMWLKIAETSEIHYIETATATYRVLGESASHSANVRRAYKFMKSGFLVRRFFLGRIPAATSSDAQVSAIEQLRLSQLCLRYGLIRALLRRIVLPRNKSKQIRLRFAVVACAQKAVQWARHGRG